MCEWATCVSGPCVRVPRVASEWICGVACCACCERSGASHTPAAPSAFRLPPYVVVELERYGKDGYADLRPQHPCGNESAPADRHHDIGVESLAHRPHTNHTGRGERMKRMPRYVSTRDREGLLCEVGWCEAGWCEGLST